MKINLTDDELATVVTALKSVQFENCLSDETREKAFALREKTIDLIKGMILNA